jgi:hypothetical protein
VQFIRAVEYAKYLGGSTDRAHSIAQAIEIALAQDKDFHKALAARPARLRRPALSASFGGPFTFPRP